MRGVPVSARRSAYADQARAAVAEAEQIAARAAARAGAEWRPGLENATAARLVRELNGRAMFGLPTCGHLPASPGVGWWVAWSPELMRCGRCARDVLVATRGTSEDNRCDGCGRLVGLIHPAILQGGAVVITLGLCSDCEADR